MSADGPGTDLSPSLVARLAGETTTANGIYGIIVCSAVLASVHGQTVPQLAVATLVTLVVYWSAERYAHVMAQQTMHPSRLSGRMIGQELRRGWKLVTVSFLPLAVLVGSRLLGASVSGSVLAALVCSTALLSAAGWRVGQEAHLGTVGRLVATVCAATFGVAMILLKTLLH